jgi:hypothetical protein
LYNQFKDIEDFGTQIDRLISPELNVADGLAKYIFISIKRHQDIEKLDVIKKKDWYKQAWLNSVYSLEDEYIDDEDLLLNKNIFLKGGYNSYFVLSRMFRRFDISVYKKLNIQTLSALIRTLDIEEYKSLMHPYFLDRESHYYVGRKYVIEIVLILNGVERMMSRGDLNEIPWGHCIVELILLLGPCVRYWESRMKFYEIFERYFQQYNSQAKGLIASLLDIDNELFHDLYRKVKRKCGVM